MLIGHRVNGALGRLATAVAGTACRRDSSVAARNAVEACNVGVKLLSARFFWVTPSLWERRVVPCPTLADSITSGDISQWVKKEGDNVEADGVVCVLETDKVDIEISSPVSGVVTKLFAEQGQTVEVGQELFEVDTEGQVTTPAKTASEEAKPAVTSEQQTPQSPVQQTSMPKGQEQAVSTVTAPVTPTSKDDAFGESRVRMSRMRLRTAERLKDAQNTAAMLTTFNEVDMTNLTDMRNRNKDDFLKKHNVKLGFMSGFLAAATSALKDQPVVNAVIDGQDIVYRDRIDISVAVSSPKGLVVPVIRGCNNFSFADFEKAISALSKKARDGTIAIEDMVGGTFTVSNGGVFGSLLSTPIINPPQSAILGMHGIQARPVAVNGKIEIRPMMYIALSYDHRLIDGREAVGFLRHIKMSVEDPSRLLLDM